MESPSLPKLVFFADKHNDTTATLALMNALPLLIKEGFDTLCVETPSIPEVPLQDLIKVTEVDFKIRTAIEKNDQKQLEILTNMYGEEVIDAEKSIKTSSKTYEARGNLIKLCSSKKITYFPIDVEFPAKTSMKDRNIHMEERVKLAIFKSKTKKIIIFCGYAHILNYFEKGFYNRGLVSRLPNIENRIYFAYSAEDKGYDSVQTLKNSVLPMDILCVQEIKIINDNFEPFLKQIALDLKNLTLQTLDSSTKPSSQKTNFSEKESKEKIATESSSNIGLSGAKVLENIHNNLVEEIKQVKSINEVYLNKYLKFFNEKNYGKALRTACNSCKSTNKDKSAFEIIKIILSYKEKLGININEKNTDGKAAIDYAADNQEVYDLLEKHRQDGVTIGGGVSSSTFIVSAVAEKLEETQLKSKGDKVNDGLTFFSPARLSPSRIQLLIAQGTQKISERNGISIISIIFSDPKLAGQLQQALKEEGIYNLGMLGNARKINEILPDLNSNANPTYGIDLTDIEYEDVMGKGSFAVLVSSQQQNNNNNNNSNGKEEEEAPANLAPNPNSR